jgi:hypothetical protein
MTSLITTFYIYPLLLVRSSPLLPSYHHLSVGSNPPHIRWMLSIRFCIRQLLIGYVQHPNLDTDGWVDGGKGEGGSA